MKTFGKIVIGVVICVLVVLGVLRITGLDPHNRIPGLWLNGQLITAPVNDWSFTDNVPQVHLQTETWYLLPHSVTINCIAYNHNLYLASVYPGHGPRTWNDDVMRDPRVRIQIGHQLYDRELSLVTDPVEKAAVLQARARKYPLLKIPANATIRVFRVFG
ncbi:MAG: hypothetical protein KGL75_00025 [Acidobacteriota bacterium]|nr:hypothetical protein [Acidobacteriota bacterium]